MLPEVGALEWLIIADVALIVVGPKDLPMLLRQLGQFVAKLRGMASEFRASFDEMARQSELDDLRKEVEAMRKGQFLDMAGHDEMMKAAVGDIEQGLADVGVSLGGGPETFNYDAAVADAPPLTITEAPKPANKPRAKAKTNGAAAPQTKASLTKAPAAKSARPASAAKPKAASAAKARSTPPVEAAPRRKAGKIVEAGS